VVTPLASCDRKANRRRRSVGKIALTRARFWVAQRFSAAVITLF
jgi:hypothetical protein